MRKFTLALAVLTVVCIFADPAEAIGRRKRNNNCNTCSAPAVAPVSQGCGGCGAGVAAGYPSYYQPGVGQAYMPQGYQPNGVAQAGFIPPTSVPNILPARGNEVKVRLTDNSSDPATLTIAPGTTVRWVNEGKNARMVSSVKNDWKSDEIAPGQEFTATFTQPGTFEYFCGSSKDVKEMKGTIVVK